MIRDVFGLTVGTLTRIPVPAPKRVDRRVTGWMMSLAPLVGMLLGIAAAVIIAALIALVTFSSPTDAGAFAYSPMPVSILATGADGVGPLPALLIATVVVAFGAWVTRGMHLDGLADLTDALGSWKPPAQALEVAKRSDIGPFGVIALVLVLLVQVVALAMLIGAGLGTIAIVVAMTAGRIAAPVAARRGVPAARPDGLGAAAAGTVPRIVPVAWTLVVGAAAFALLRLAMEPFRGTVSYGTVDLLPTSFVQAFVDALRIPAGLPVWPLAGALAVVLAALSAAWVVRVARKRLGGMTGDVIGAAVEAATTVALVALALLA